MTILRPFWSYYGAKFRMARKLGPPQRGVLIEPFAGSACYACYWAGYTTKTILIDADPLIAGLWRYLINVRETEIMRLPINIEGVDEMKRTCQEAKWLVGFWFNKGLARPAVNRSSWARNPLFHRNLWSEPIRERIASQLQHIRHWQIMEGSYTTAPNIEAHWHIDPPYQGAGYGYKCNTIDYPSLGTWCRARKGFVQVCEHSDADWLPFVEFARTKGTLGKGRKSVHSKEAIYQSGQLRLSLFNHEPTGESNHDNSDRKGTRQGNQDKNDRQSTGIPSRSRASHQRIGRRKMEDLVQ